MRMVGKECRRLWIGEVRAQDSMRDKLVSYSRHSGSDRYLRIFVTGSMLTASFRLKRNVALSQGAIGR